MNRQTRTAWIALAIVAVLGLGIAGFAQSAATNDPSAAIARVLLIDETRTFAATMRVGALAGALRQAGVDLEVRLETVPTSYIDPLAEADAPDEPFDLVLLIPMGIEDGSAREVWMLYSRATAMSADSHATLEPLRALLAAVFDGVASPVGVADDLWVAGLASLYEARKWLR